MIYYTSFTTRYTILHHMTDNTSLPDWQYFNARSIMRYYTILTGQIYYTWPPDILNWTLSTLSYVTALSSVLHRLNYNTSLPDLLNFIASYSILRCLIYCTSPPALQYFPAWSTELYCMIYYTSLPDLLYFTAWYTMFHCLIYCTILPDIE